MVPDFITDPRLSRFTVDSRHAGDWHRVFDHDEFDSFVITDGTGSAVLHAPFQLQLDPYDARSENVPQAVFDLAKQAGAKESRSARWTGSLPDVSSAVDVMDFTFL
jgi:hypothetical protein